jgi:hypothetical protein
MLGFFATNRRSVDCGAVLFFLIACFISFRVLRPDTVFPLDDGFIVLHSAQVLHAGSDPNYPGVSPLFGATSAPFLALVYLLLFALSPIQALGTACWIGILFYCSGLIRMAHAFHLPRQDGLLLGVLGVTASFIPFHLLNGVETSWALAGVAWTLALASEDSKSYGWAAFSAGLTASIRPELLPFAAIVIFILAARLYRERSVKPPSIALLGAAALVPIALCSVWYFHSTGVPFPQTGLAKHFFFADSSLPWTKKLLTESRMLLAFLFGVGILCTASAELFRSGMGRGMILFAAIFVLTIYIQFPTALVWNRFRYPVVLIPIFLWALGKHLSRDPSRARRILRLSVAYSLLFATVPISAYIRDSRYYGDALRDVAAWCIQNLPANSTLLVHDAGYIAYATPFRIVDMVGLKTPSAIPLNRTITFSSGGGSRGVAVADLATETGASHLVLLKNWGPTVDLVSQLQDLKWKVELVRPNGEYRVYSLEAPAGHLGPR